MDLTALVWLVLGLVVLTIGAEFLVRGASRLAATAKIPPLVIGLTVVAFGTSAPELAVSVKSAFAGQPDIAIGNVVGSNICNVLLILGLSASVAPLVVSAQLVRLDVPIMIGATLLMYGMALDGHISRIDGLILVGCLVAYTVFTIRQGRQAGVAAAAAAPAVPSPAVGRVLADFAFLILGLAGLVIGAGWFVDAATSLARAFGVSELVIGLTIVAIGTSLPELAASVMASLKGERDIAVGNVVGSNLFNILSVLGVTATASPTGVAVADAALSFDIPVMTAVSIACLPVFLRGHRIDRWEGFVFLGYYVAYTAYLVLAATDHESANAFATVMRWFVLPLTGLTLAITMARAWRVRRRGR